MEAWLFIGLVLATPASGCEIHEDALERAACEEAAETRKSELDPNALPADEVLVGVLNTERWSYAEGDNEGFLTLVYGPPNSEGAVLMRCRADEGFVLVTFDVVTPRGSESLRAAEVFVSAPARTRRSEMTGGHISTVAIPSDHELFLAMALGYTLSIGERHFPVATDRERQTIARFMRGCLSA